MKGVDFEMEQVKKEHTRFFEYLNLAKQEFKTLVEIHPELSQLSNRELEVFELLLSDRTLSEIAEEMFISHSSVHFHCKNIYKKLGISSRRQLLMTSKDLYK